MRGKQITLNEARELIKNHRDSGPCKDNAIRAYTIDGACLQHILSQPGCVAVRFLRAKNKISDSSLDTTLVAVGVDALGKNMITPPLATKTAATLQATTASVSEPIIYQHLEICPPSCDDVTDAGL